MEFVTCGGVDGHLHIEVLREARTGVASEEHVVGRGSDIDGAGGLPAAVRIDGTGRSHCMACWIDHEVRTAARGRAVRGEHRFPQEVTGRRDECDAGRLDSGGAHYTEPHRRNICQWH